MSELLTKAKLARSGLTTKTRENGERFVYQKDNAPEWLNDLCHDAHGSLLPDDFIYSVIEDALDAIIDNDGDTDSVELEADIYTRDLLDWLGSHSSRVAYCDKAAEEFGAEFDGDIIWQIQMGQHLEKREILENVISSLEKLDLEEESL